MLLLPHHTMKILIVLDLPCVGLVKSVGKHQNVNLSSNSKNSATKKHTLTTKHKVTTERILMGDVNQVILIVTQFMLTN